MQKANEFRQHAVDCRALAAQMDSAHHRDQLLQMAETWERMAAERERALRLERPELAADQPGPVTPR